MNAFLSVFLITLGLGQITAAIWRLRGASLVGGRRWAGFLAGAVLLLGGGWLLPNFWAVLGWTLLAGPLAVLVLLLASSYVFPPPHPNHIFDPQHPAHAGCQAVRISDGDSYIPGLWLMPLLPAPGTPAVCIVPGAGDNKTFFKWRLVRALLAQGFYVLVIDMPGHGDDRHRQLVYPDCLTAVPAAVRFLRNQPEITQVGLIGISLGGALAVRSLVEDPAAPVDALVVMETSTELNYTRALFYRELWRTLYGSPAMSLLQEVSVRQLWQDWHSGGYHSRHTVGELFGLLNPLDNLKKLKKLPLLLVYSRRDSIAPLSMGRTMLAAAPHAKLLAAKRASHVMLTLLPRLNSQIAGWLREQFD